MVFYMNNIKRIIFEAGWSSYEEHSHVLIYEKNNKYYLKENSHNVYSGDYNKEEIISEEEAISIMLETYEDCNYEIMHDETNPI